MGYLIQTCGIPDTSKFTFSGWVRCPTADIPTGDNFPTLFTFASLDGESNPIATYISLNKQPALYESVGDPPVSTQVGVLENNVSVRLCANFDSGGGPEPSDMRGFDSNANVVNGETWHHILVSVDTSTDDTGNEDDILSHKLVTIYVDGADQYRQEFRGGTNTNEVVAESAFDILVNGAEFGFPAGIGYYIELQPEMNFADVQIWLGTYIDGANISAFIADGNPVDTAVAALRFGEPTFLFRGDNVAFRVNSGADGAVSAVGTITDFTPGP